ncbi:hypothetical protein K502DRAFT_290074 [Neoconidiobolus thromboides FSU 785]|nr:hypothetical protein K502DRAFT_290074 [Neoconidiobolus thromboides FSU 785]
MNPSAVKINKIMIEAIDKFKSDKIGFIKLKVDSVSLENDAKIPGIILLRGNSVSTLILLTCEEDISIGKEEYVLLTSQPRLAAGEESLLELPAGMLDEEDNLHVKAIQEVEEETGLKIKNEELKLLNKQGHHTSPGLLDEKVYFFFTKLILKRKELNAINNKLTGLRKEGELITLKLMPISEALNQTNDIKILSAYTLYQMRAKE